MDVARAIDGTFEQGDEGRFTGEVWLRSALGDEAGTTIGIVHFSPDARTRWHRHATGQFLYAITAAVECARAARSATCWNPAT